MMSQCSISGKVSGSCNGVFAAASRQARMLPAVLAGALVIPRVLYDRKSEALDANPVQFQKLSQHSPITIMDCIRRGIGQGSFEYATTKAPIVS